MTASSNLQNRVDPTGDLIADPARGSLMGNRGLLHDEQQRIQKPYALKRWIICLLEFKGRQRQIMGPGNYTELFFLDEATALAAGHRPCAECQRSRYNEFREAWSAGNAGLVDSSGKVAATHLDGVLHSERVGPDKRKQTFRAPLEDLPEGVFIIDPESDQVIQPLLIWDGHAWIWRPGGYERWAAVDVESVEVLTPRSTVNALAAGYRPVVAL